MTKRLIASYAVITLLVLVLLEVPFGVFYAQREMERMTAEVEHDANFLATIFEDALEGGVTPSAAPAQRYAQVTGARVVVVDSHGISVIDTGGETARDFTTRPEIAEALTGNRATGTRHSDTLGVDLLYVAVPVASSGVVHGALRLTLDASGVTNRIHRFWWGLAAIAAVALIAAGLAGWLISRSLTVPLRRLTDAARRFGSGDLRPDPGPAQGPPEYRELAATMSTMAARLAELIDEQRAFVADASHQLRTPLTGLRLRLENLSAEIPEASEAQVDAALDEVTRLGALVNDLLQLARADRPQEPAVYDLAAMTRERIDTWGALASAADVRIVLDDDGGSLSVSAVPGAIEQILDNLLDNAIGVAPPGSTITVALVPGASEHRLVISDEGPGLSDEAKAHALRRFWRGDTSRPGTGLGLTIADGLARASGGALHLGDAPGHGLRVTITFRRAATGASEPGPTGEARAPGGRARAR